MAAIVHTYLCFGIQNNMIFKSKQYNLFSECMYSPVIFVCCISQLSIISPLDNLFVIMMWADAIRIPEWHVRKASHL